MKRLLEQAAAGLLLALIGLLATGCGKDQRSNVVLITIDTLRADRLGCYGFSPAHTPHLDRLAHEGLLFTEAYAQVPLTLPSHASILTGLYPPEHGSRLNATYNFRRDLPTLATILQQEGYATGAFVSAYVLDSAFGLNVGFDVYDDQMQGTDFDVPERSAAETVSRALAWLEEESEAPFFLWVHLFEPHYPYTPAEPFVREFAQNPYDGEIATADAAIGELMSFFEARAILDDTLIVATSDHGESLGEHGERTHGILIYDATMRVPLIVRPPAGKEGEARRTGRHVDGMVETIDIAPTVLASLSIEIPPAMGGIDLLADPLTPRNTGYAESLTPLAYRWSPLYSRREGNWKFIKAPEPELYDTGVDPGELVNRSEENSSRVHQMDEALTTYLAENEIEPGDTEESERWENLEHLGYLGGALPERTGGEELSWPDPKKRMGNINRIMDALNLLRLNQQDLALRLLLPLMQSEDRNPYFRKIMGRAYLQKGEVGSAVEQFRAYYELSSQDPDAAYDLAVALATGEQFEEARVILERCVETEPQYARGWDMLAVILASLDDLDSALEAGRRAIELEPENTDFYLHLGNLCMDFDRHEQAAEFFARALELDPRDTKAKRYLREAESALARGHEAG